MPKAASFSRNAVSHASNRARRTSGRSPPFLPVAQPLAAVPGASQYTTDVQSPRSPTEPKKISEKGSDEEDPKVIHKRCYEVIGRADHILTEARQRSSNTIRQLNADKAQLSAEKQQAIDEISQLKSEIQQVKQELELATTNFQHQRVQVDEQRFVLEVHAMALALTNKLWSRTEAHRNASIGPQLQFPDMAQASWSDNAGQYTALNSHPLPANHLSGTQDGLAQFNTYSSIS
ncbi:hypothetical protein NUU61_001445 [Penicillium alfredii]|uniref:Uncharacterized protein n=1 Tax=Penicillium alfredii TaxID=1506179 RepID=A0A9W9G537_9EURO|nr:uncharacterized protein NUU61_001445 [Penicillium alfredii]KAJ5111815.1 hypothetical protein NUU61_001445 [Penicillium alfredii]